MSCLSLSRFEILWRFLIEVLERKSRAIVESGGGGLAGEEAPVTLDARIQPHTTAYNRPLDINISTRRSERPARSPPHQRCRRPRCRGQRSIGPRERRGSDESQKKCRSRWIDSCTSFVTHLPRRGSPMRSLPRAWQTYSPVSSM